MIKNNILVNTETRKIKKKDYDFLGVSGENSIEQIVFKLSAFIEGEAILEIEKYNKENKIETHYFELQKEDESYVFEVKSSLLDVAKDVKMQLHITTENVEVFKSRTFEMKVYEAINATKTIPEEYSEWIDIANSKIAIIDKLNTDFTKLKEEVEQSETERNSKVEEAVNKITDMTEDYNENAKKKVEEFDSNATEKIKDYNDNTTEKEKAYKGLAEEKEAELNEIADGVKDMATAIQFANFKVNRSNMHLQIITAKKLGNTSFTLNKKSGRLGVRIVNGK